MADEEGRDKGVTQKYQFLTRQNKGRILYFVSVFLEGEQWQRTWFGYAVSYFDESNHLE